MNWELPDVHAGFRKDRGTRDQIANTWWIIEKATEFQKNIYLCFTDYTEDFDCVNHNKLWKILKELGILDHLTPINACIQSKPRSFTSTSTYIYIYIYIYIYTHIIYIFYIKSNLCVYPHPHPYIHVNVHVVLHLHGAHKHICIYLGFLKILDVLVNKWFCALE